MKAETLIIKGLLSEMPEEQRKKVEAAAEQIRAIIRADQLNSIALAIVALELDEANG